MKFPAQFILDPAALMKIPAQFIAGTVTLMKFSRKKHEIRCRRSFPEWIFAFSGALSYESGCKKHQPGWIMTVLQVKK